MKQLILLCAMILSGFSAISQENNSNEIETLFSDQTSMGFYGSLSLGYSQINDKDALVSGFRGAVIFNHNTAIGLAGYGFVNNLDGPILLEGNNIRYSLAGGYGGIFIEPIVAGLKPVHVAFPVLLGMGGIARIRHYGYGYWEHQYIETPESDLFFIVQPAVELEFNLARFFRTAATFSYRLTSEIELNEVSRDVLDGFTFGLTFKFGRF